MRNEPPVSVLVQLPGIYETEDTEIEDKIIHLHFFIGSSHWYIAEYDPKHRIFFGYAILNGDTRMAEWGYIPYDELRQIRIEVTMELTVVNERRLHTGKIRIPHEVEWDETWLPKPFREIPAEHQGLV